MPEPAGKPKVLPWLERALDLSRILAFTDGMFAIAISLLVLQIEVPGDLTGNRDFIKSLGDPLPDLFAFGMSFAEANLPQICFKGSGVQFGQSASPMSVPC